MCKLDSRLRWNDEVWFNFPSFKQFITALATALILDCSLPAFAAEMTKEQKNECLLASRGCATAADTIQEKIKKLEAEVKKGTKVYSAAEIKKLNAKLKEANDLLDGLLRN